MAFSLVHTSTKKLNLMTEKTPKGKKPPSKTPKGKISTYQI